MWASIERDASNFFSFDESHLSPYGMASENRRQKSKQLEITVMRGLFMAFSRRIQLIIVNERLQPPESIARKEKNAKLARFAKRKKKSIQNQHIHGNKIVWNAIEKIYKPENDKNNAKWRSHWNSKFRSKLSFRLQRTASARPLRHVFKYNMGLFAARLVSSPNSRGVFFLVTIYCWVAYRRTWD